ncbi:MFS general substrate transporter [Acaromyces ingoldii]|uniref:MFS general substrate transporter n=1 Tax=Acaromyces ingoldii TaxID=215250 RepID=A0A316YUU6_9BASI|nr:MFS general substrate transporter [Acaromyces ingoldii]PWN93049.1 MFS general substrate transporter [Acaromyces ingoldii]
MQSQHEQTEDDGRASTETVSPPHQEPEKAAQSKEDAKALEEQRERQQSQAAEEPYSIFTAWAKWQIVILVTIAGFISPMTANIMLPALPNIANDLKVSLESVNLTVTVYMIFQGITPLFLGSLTDIVGRRPVYLVCFIIYEGANAGIANLPNSYAGLLVLRCLQATGAASVISIGAGAIGDVTTRAERGSFMGVFSSGSMAGPSLGPVVGAVLTQAFHWRSIFWFCFVIGGVVLVLSLFFLPETLRRLVGNGSRPAPTLFHEALFDLMRGKTAAQQLRLPRPGLPPSPVADKATTRSKRLARELARPFQALLLLAMPEVFLCLILCAIPYTAFYCVSSTLSNLFQDTYGLNTLQVGLVFLSPGIGSSLSSYLMGLVLDHDYAAALKRAREDGQKDDVEVPIEHVRLRRFPYALLGTVLTLIAYGWCVRYKVHMAAAIIFLFINGFCIGCIFSIVQVLLIDWLPNKGASVTGCNNLMRCLSGAVGTAVIDYVLSALKPGWTFTLTALITALTAPVALWIDRSAPAWRRRRSERQQGQIP